MENTTIILTIREVAEVLRCSKAHVQKALVGKIAGVPQLAHLSLGRRKLVRKEWLEQWMEASKKR
jgi:excisionase family DNA binding protein